MNILQRTTNWLETRACIPAYGGWVLVGIAICFFGAAINTMTGWLYVMCGLSFALLGVAAFLPPRLLAGLVIHRFPIGSVTAGDDLKIELEIVNHKKQAVNWLSVRDILPIVLGKPIQKAIEVIPHQDRYHWVYYHPTQRRGVYRWHTVELESGAPLGLFWCRRLHTAAAKAVVYPKLLPLNICPLIDEIGQEQRINSDLRGIPHQAATQGLVRSLRPYRIGDPIRLVHWRSSARYGELRVRELEIITSGEDIIIALDTSSNWEEDNFEQAVIAAISLYDYATHKNFTVQLWTARTNLVKSKLEVLETLAASNPGEDGTTSQPPKLPLIWLTQNPLTLCSLNNNSRWILWQSSQPQQVVVNQNFPGLIVKNNESLQTQLQSC